MFAYLQVHLSSSLKGKTLWSPTWKSWFTKNNSNDSHATVNHVCVFASSRSVFDILDLQIDMNLED